MKQQITVNQVLYLCHINILFQYPHIKFNDIEKVKMMKLDDYLNIEERNKYNLINIDVQGYELEVFKGAYHVLGGIDYIISEVNRDKLYQGCPLVEEIDEFLKIFGFVRKETNWEGQTWGDAFYLKERRSLGKEILK